jgi:hypothetical protein
MKMIMPLRLGITAFFVLSVIACSKQEPGDEPEDFVTMKQMINVPLTHFFLDDFSMKPDDGFLLAGYNDRENNISYDAVVINMKPKGEIIWMASFTIDTFKYAAATCAIEESNGSVLVAGICGNTFSSQNRFMARLDASGEVMNHTLFDVPAGYQAWYSRLIPRSDGNTYLISSYTPPEGSVKYAVEIDLLDASGNILFRNLYEDMNVRTDHVSMGENNELMLAGTAEPGIYDGSPDFFCMQIDKDGNEILQKTFGSPSNFEYGNYCIKESADGLVFSGTSNPSGACAIYRINPAGIFTDTTFINKYSNYASENFILKTKASGYLVMSITYSHFIFIRINEDLGVKWSTSIIRRLPHGVFGQEEICHFVPSRNGYAFVYQRDSEVNLIKIRDY